MMNKKGMTLVELMVYMVLAAMLLAPVIMLVQNSSVTMARDASNVSLRMTGREILNIMYDDLKNTGYKLDPSSFKANDSVTYLGSSNITNFHKADSACKANVSLCGALDNFDISSFMPGAGSGYFDELAIRKGVLSESGVFIGIDTVKYKVYEGANDTTLLRRGVEGVNSKPAVTLARNIKALKFLYSSDLLEWKSSPDIADKNNTQYIKVIMVTKDPKKLSPTKTTTIALSSPVDTVKFDDGALYERHEIVVPIPNNGLFP